MERTWLSIKTIKQKRIAFFLFKNLCKVGLDFVLKVLFFLGQYKLRLMFV